jgi:hypothetical protein
MCACDGADFGHAVKKLWRFTRGNMFKSNRVASGVGKINGAVTFSQFSFIFLPSTFLAPSPAPPPLKGARKELAALGTLNPL